MTITNVVKMSVNININSLSWDSTNLDNLCLQMCNNTPGFKPLSLKEGLSTLTFDHIKNYV